MKQHFLSTSNLMLQIKKQAFDINLLTFVNKQEAQILNIYSDSRT